MKAIITVKYRISRSRGERQDISVMEADSRNMGTGNIKEDEKQQRKNNDNMMMRISMS
jgi:hypothetical protein